MGPLVPALVALLAWGCASNATQNLASLPLARAVPYRSIAIEVGEPAVVALRPPISFGRGLTPEGFQAWEAYSETLQRAQAALERQIRVIPTSADRVAIAGKGGAPGRTVEREDLPARYGFVLVAPGRKPGLLSGAPRWEDVVRAARKYFDLQGD